jgi:hypothetical protein
MIPPTSQSTTTPEGIEAVLVGRDLDVKVDHDMSGAEVGALLRTLGLAIADEQVVSHLGTYTAAGYQGDRLIIARVYHA